MDVRTRKVAQLVAVPLTLFALAVGQLSHGNASNPQAGAGASAAGTLDVPELVAGKTTRGTGRRVR